MSLQFSNRVWICSPKHVNFLTKDWRSKDFHSRSNQIKDVYINLSDVFKHIYYHSVAMGGGLSKVISNIRLWSSLAPTWTGQKIVRKVISSIKLWFCIAPTPQKQDTLRKVISNIKVCSYLKHTQQNKRCNNWNSVNISFGIWCLSKTIPAPGTLRKLWNYQFTDYFVFVNIEAHPSTFPLVHQLKQINRDEDQGTVWSKNLSLFLLMLSLLGYRRRR